MPGSTLSSDQNAVMATKPPPPPVAPRSGRASDHWTSATLPAGDEIVHARSGSVDSVESSGSSSCSGGGRPDAVPEYVPSRTPYKAPRANTNALQFVKVQSPLYKKAEQQLQLTEEVKITREAMKEGDEDWQSNLDNWKSRRRKVSEKVIQRAEEMRQIEIEEQIRQEHVLQQQRKIKKFSEMVEKRGSTRSYHLDLCGGDDSGLGGTPEPDDATSESGEEAREREPPKVAKKPWVTKAGPPDDTPTVDEIFVHDLVRKELSDNASSTDAVSSEDDVSYGGPAGNADSGMESLGDFRPSDCASDLSQDSGSDQPDSQEAPLLASEKNSDGVERCYNLVVKPGDSRGFGFSLKGGKDQGCAAYVDSVTKGGAAELCGMQEGDAVLLLNGESTRGCSHASLVFAVKQALYTGVLHVATAPPQGEKPKLLQKGSSFAERLALFSNGVPPQPKSPTPVVTANLFKPEEAKSESLVLRRRSAFENGNVESSDFKSRRASHIPSQTASSWTNEDKRHSADWSSLPALPPEGSKKGRPPPVPMKPKLRAMTSPSAELQRDASTGGRGKFVKQQTLNFGLDDAQAAEGSPQFATLEKEPTPPLPSPPPNDVCESPPFLLQEDVCESPPFPLQEDVCESSPPPDDICRLPPSPPLDYSCELPLSPPLDYSCGLPPSPPLDYSCELPPSPLPDEVCESPPSFDDGADHTEEPQLSFTENKMTNSIENDFSEDQEVSIVNSGICDSKLLDYPKLDFFSTTIEEEFSSPSSQLAESPVNETAPDLNLDPNPTIIPGEPCDLYSGACADQNNQNSSFSDFQSEDRLSCQEYSSHSYENEADPCATSPPPTDSVQVVSDTAAAPEDEKPFTPPSANTHTDVIRNPDSNELCGDLLIAQESLAKVSLDCNTDDAQEMDDVDESFESCENVNESSLEEAVDQLESLYNLELTNLKNSIKSNLSPLCLPLEKIDEDDVVSASTATSSDSPNTETVIETSLSPLPCDEDGRPGDEVVALMVPEAFDGDDPVASSSVAPDPFVSYEYSRELDESLDQITALDVIDEMEMRLMRQLEQQGDASFEDVCEDLTERLGEVVDREWLYLTEEAALLDDLSPKNVDPPREPPPPPPPPEMDHQSKNAFARANSTKRIKKELWRRRSDFLGLDASEDGIDGDNIPPPPPGLEEILKQERAQNQWLEKRLSLAEADCLLASPPPPALHGCYNPEEELNCEETQEDYMEILEEESSFQDSLYNLSCEEEEEQFIVPSSMTEPSPGSPQHKAKQHIQSLGAAPRAKIMNSDTWITQAERDLPDRWTGREAQWRRPVPPPAARTESNEPEVACACCGTALSGGAAMGIAALQLCFHLECFRCCACGAPLGNGSCGADVQVRDRRLFCPRCFSAC